MRTKKTFIFLLLLLSFASCKKTNFCLKDITETDANGNYIGNIDKSDWQLVPYDQLSEADKKVFNIEIMTILINDMHIDKNTLKFNCPLPSSFEYIAYPNPVNKSGKVNFILKTVIKFETALYSVYNPKNKTVYTSAAGASVDNHLITTFKTQESDFSDCSIYYMIMTPDSCVYAGKGDIKIN